MLTHADVCGRKAIVWVGPRLACDDCGRLPQQIAGAISLKKEKKEKKKKRKESKNSSPGPVQSLVVQEDEDTYIYLQQPGERVDGALVAHSHEHVANARRHQHHCAPV
jgi:hypothetical protein